MSTEKDAELSEQAVALLNEIDTQGEILRHLVDKLEARARTQGDIDGRWVAMGRSDLQRGLMALQRAVEKPSHF